MADSLRLDAQNPWPGLASFAEADSAFFRGRETEADELGRLVRRERLTVLFGRSGLGKSSVLNAGLFPKLRDDLHLPVVVRLGYGASVSLRQQVWDALEAACTENAIEASPPQPRESMWAYFHRAGSGFWNLRRRPVLPVLVFDQFEELFTLGQADEAAREAAQDFLAELADLIEDRPSEALRYELEEDPARGEALDFERRGCKVVLCFREDFLAEMEGLRRRIPSIMRNRYRLLPMNAAQARAVIASGGDIVGYDVRERILGLAWRNRAEAPTTEEAERIEIDPALLSVICSELNLRRRNTGAATIEPGLLGDAETEILAEFYERSLRGQDPRVRAFIEDELITAAGYRDSFAFDDALARPGITKEALDSLVTGRLLRVDERFGVRRLELTHDVLTRVVKENRDARRAREAEAAARERERDATLRQQRARRRERLVWAGGLATALLFLGAIWASKWAMDRDKAATLMEDQAQREQNKAWVAMAELSVTTDELTAGSLAAEQRAKDEAESAARASARAETSLAAAKEQTRRANQIERNALATDLIVAARTAPKEQVQLRLLLGAEAVRRYPERLDGQVEQLARLVAAHRVRRVIAFDAPIVGSAASKDGSRVLVGSQRGQLTLVDARNGDVIARWQVPVTERGIDRLAIRASADLRVALFDIDDTPQLARLTPGQPLRMQLFGRRGSWDKLVLSSDGRLAANTEPAATHVEIYEVLDGATKSVLHPVVLPRPGALRCMSFDVIPGRLVIGTADETWSVHLTDGRIDRLNVSVRALAHSEDCTTAVVQDKSPSGGTRYRTVDISTGAGIAVVKELAPTQAPSIGQPSFVANGTFIAASVGNELELWPVAGGSILGVRQPSRQWSGTADGRWLAFVLDDAQVELFRRAEPAHTTRFALPQVPVALHFVADGSSLTAIGNDLLQIIRLENRSVLKVEQVPFYADEIEFSADGSHLGAGGRGADGFKLAMFDAKAGQPVEIDSRFNTIEFSLDGAVFAAHHGGSDARVQVFELPAAGQMRLKAEFALPGESYPDKLALDTHGRRLAVSVKGAILIRDLHDKSFQPRIALGDKRAQRIAFHPRESVLAVVLNDGGVRAYGLPDGRERWHIASVKEPVREHAVSVAYSPGGESLVVGRDDGVVGVHDPRTGDRRLVLEPPRSRSRGGTTPASNLVFIEGTTILSAGELDGVKHFWDLATRRWLGVVGADPGRDSESKGQDLLAVAISSRGRRLALRHANETVSLHGWDPDTLVRDACVIAGRNLTCNEWRRFIGDTYRKTCEALPPPEQVCR